MKKIMFMLARSSKTLLLLGFLGLVGTFGIVFNSADSRSNWLLAPFFATFLLGSVLVFLLQRLIDITLTFRRAEEKRLNQLGVTVRSTSTDISRLNEVLADEMSAVTRVEDEDALATVAYHLRETSAGLQLVNLGLESLDERWLSLQKNIGSLEKVCLVDGGLSTAVDVQSLVPLTQQDSDVASNHKSSAYNLPTPDDAETRQLEVDTWNSNLISWMQRVYSQSGGVLPRTFTVAPKMISNARDFLSRDDVVVDFGVDSMTYFLAEYGSSSKSLYVVESDLRLNAISTEVFSGTASVYGAVELAVNGVLSDLGSNPGVAICILLTEPSTPTMDLLREFCRRIPKNVLLKIVSIPRVSQNYVRDDAETNSLLKSLGFRRHDSFPESSFDTWRRPVLKVQI